MHTRVKALLDIELKDPRYGEGWTKAVRGYLLQNTRFFLNDLMKAARTAHDEEGYVGGDVDLKALARLDWQACEPILRDHAKSTQLRVAALAVSLLYRHALEVNDAGLAKAQRDRLKHIVEDRAQPGRARDTAAQALLTSRWEGRDAWYWSLLEDASLRDLKDGYMLLSPLCEIEMNTELWIQQLAQRTAGTNRTVRDAAVTCLVAFHLDNARRDALLPLLPWLSDPKWSAARDRLRLIQSMDRLEMPESVPGLISVLAQDDDSDRSYAAESLMHYKDVRAIPALRKALERTENVTDRRRIARALVAANGVGTAEAVHSVEALATAISTKKGAEELDSLRYAFRPAKRIPSEILIGLVLAETDPPDDAVVQSLITREHQVEKEQPAVAKALMGVLGKWPGNAVDLDLLNRIESQQADADAVRSAVLRRKTLRKTCAAKLAGLTRTRGVPAGIAAVLLGDAADTRLVLDGSDRLAQAALLAAARLAGEKLVVAQIGGLLDSSEPLVRLAAEAYLMVDDSAEARKLVLARHPGEALILGARQQGDPGHFSYSAFDEMEKQLRGDAREGADAYALLTAGYWGDAGQVIVRLGVAPEVMFVEDPARYYTRTLTVEEVAALREYVNKSGIEDQGPLATSVSDGMQFEYVHVSASGGRRVFMNNPGVGGAGADVYTRTCDYFRALLATGSFTLRYRAEKTVPGFSVLAADNRASILGVWEGDGGLRLLVTGGRRGATGLAYAGHAQVTLPSTEEQQVRWFAFADGRLGGETTAPPGFAPLDLHEGVPSKMEMQDHLHAAPWDLVRGNSTYRVGTWKDKSGLWLCTPKGDPVLLLEGNVAMPVLTPDGKWGVVAKTDNSWAEPNYVVRVNLETGSAQRLDIPVADTFDPIAYVPARRKVLLERVRDRERYGSSEIPVGPEKPEFRLLDAETGHSEVVTGEFEPFFDQSLRSLQSTGKPGEVWAAIHDHKSGETRVGRYDTSQFRFQSVLSLPLRFTSMQMWVSREADRVFVAYNGQLISVPLHAD